LDGVERHLFGIDGGDMDANARGPETVKHDRIRARVRDQMRDPIDRMLSMYFSPHRLAGRPQGSKLTYETRFFDALVRQTPLMIEYLVVDGAVRAPSLVVRYENLATDLATMAGRFDLPAPEIPVLNRSTDRDGDRERLKQNPEVLEIVLDRFAEDYRYFGYEMPKLN